MTTAWLSGPMVHASAIRVRDSEGRAAESSSALVTTGIALSPCLDVSKPTTVQNFWRQSPRCVHKKEILQLNTEGNADLWAEFFFFMRRKITSTGNVFWRTFRFKLDSNTYRSTKFFCVPYFHFSVFESIYLIQQTQTGVRVQTCSHGTDG